MNHHVMAKWAAIAALGFPAAALAESDLRGEAANLFGRLEEVKASSSASPEVTLGRALFWDTRVSSNGNTACASCHLASSWGADPRPASIEASGMPTSRNSPTVFNAMVQPGLRWLADRKTGANQAEGSLTGSLGFASKELAVARLKDLGYAAAFAAAYPSDAEPLTSGNYGRALQAYQATLATPAPFDRFLAGDNSALGEPQRKGLRAFMSTGCASCHNGALFGGAMLQKFGVVKDYWLETGSASPDVGRFSMTRKDQDKYVFRVPMLRNVARTAPYFHDGSVRTLDRAVRVMASVQLGRTLDDETASSIVAFLESLTGEVPANYAPPPSPAHAAALH
jgi:cytochrome c peroxidase